MNIRYVTIEREYGSGGTEIARRLSEKCGIACYGAEITELAAKNIHISASEAQQYEEKVTNSFLFSIYAMSQMQSGNTDTLPMEMKLYAAEQKAVNELARKGKCIFVGHCASEALKEECGVLRVFIRADDAFKHTRMVSEYGISEKDADTVCKRFNRKRSNYYTFSTSKKWDDMTLYDMVLDSSRLGIEGCAEAIAALIQQK